MLDQTQITADTPMGATLTAGGATFRVWAPRARSVYLAGVFGGVARTPPSDALLMRRDGAGYWSGFLAGVSDGDEYRFHVIGEGSSGPKRDPYAREMARDAAFPACSCLVREASAYPWHDKGFLTPEFSNMILYQLHVGTYAPSSPGATSTFLDVVGKIEYLAALGINVLQPLPIDELESDPSLGYNGADYFSPDVPYVVYDRNVLAQHLDTINRLLAARKCLPLALADVETGPAQLKALVDLCHLYGIAVIFDVVYNHAGGFFGDDQSLYFWDRARNGDNNQSLYFTDKGWAGGLSFALWNGDVRQFIINNARYHIDEFHVDGFRYDEISVLLALNGESGRSFCADLTSTVRAVKPRAMQNAEHWPPDPAIVTAVTGGGQGFDVVQHDALRSAVRELIAQAPGGGGAAVDLDAVARSLYPAGFAHAWQAVTCIENHDIVKEGEEPRIARLADGLDPRSWYARSRSRVAAALLLTAPGTPQLFMGQEFLEEKNWSSDPHGPGILGWAGLQSGADRAMADHLRFTQDLIRLRWRQPALRGDQVRVFHVHNQNRVLAFHRWLESQGRDVIVVASLSEQARYGYVLGFPAAGRWLEVFNSDVYDGWVNPAVAGNGGAIEATGGAVHGFAASAAIVIPPSGVAVFARDAGD
jgi:1,4-alpha-glucan branching enzyme